MCLRGFRVVAEWKCKVMIRCDLETNVTALWKVSDIVMENHAKTCYFENGKLEVLP